MDEFSAGSGRLTRARWEALDSASSTSLFAISEVRGLSSPAHSLVETNQLQEMMGVVSNPSHRHTRFFFTGDAVAPHTVDRVTTQCGCLPNAGVYPMRVFTQCGCLPNAARWAAGYEGISIRDIGKFQFVENPILPPLHPRDTPR